MNETLKRELRVAFSKRAQPPAFRIIKWIVIIAGVVLFHRHPHFWQGVGGLLLASVALHLFYRWKTQNWTKPWGGWNDLDAGESPELNIERSTSNAQRPKRATDDRTTER